MKKMKFLCGLFAVTLVLSLSSCSNSSIGSGDSSSSNTSSTGSGSGAGSGSGSGAGSGSGSGAGSGSGSGSGSSGGSNVSTSYTRVDTQTINGITYDIVTFGTFPQSLKAESVSIGTETKTVGLFTYYKGSDNEWYAYKDSKYYKVEPIRWRVLTTDFNGSGKKLLLAENVLIRCCYYDYYNVNRGTDSNPIYPNNYEHSRIRAFLNGLSYEKKESDTAEQQTDSSLLNKGFLQTAFTTEEQAAIATTTVENNRRSTNPDYNENHFCGGRNSYASDPTSDKIFLLSIQEVTREAYGFDSTLRYATEFPTGIRNTTAFAELSSNFSYANCYWWLRTPYYSEDSNQQNVSGKVRYVHSNGSPLYKELVKMDQDLRGVVPALCL